MVENKHWYALYTKPRWEKKVADLLMRDNYTTYCPLNRAVRQWSDRKKVVYEPLFTSYVFVRLSTREISKVKAISGVVNFVCWLKKPAIVKDEEIVAIMQFLHEHANVRLEKAEVNVNDVVRITDGPLMQYQGNILSVSGNKVKIYLPTLGYSMVADVAKTNIEVVKKGSKLASNEWKFSSVLTIFKR